MRLATKLTLLFVLLSIIPLAACALPEAEPPPDEITVQLAWTHGALFGGLYAADQLGYYAEEGMEVTLLPRPGPGADTIGMVVDGTAGFGVDYGAGLVTAHSEGRPVIAIATLYRRHPLAFMTLADSGLTRPQDFPGHTIRTLTPGSSAVAFEAMMTRLGLDADSVEQVDVGFDLSPFLAGELDIWPGFINGGVLIAQEAGYEVNLILPEDYGVHLYGYTLFTTQQLIEENPDLVLRFLRATLRGWRWAIENPQEAGPLALKYDSTLNSAHEVAVMENSLPLIHTGEGEIGWMQAEVWTGMYDLLLDQGLLDEPFDVHEAYTMEFLQDIYGGEE